MSVFLIAFIVIVGCVVNPKYSDYNRLSSEQVQKYPNHSDQIKNNKDAYDQWYAKGLAITTSSGKYEITEEKTSGWSMGDPNAVIHVGHNKYKYHHKITIQFVCRKSSIMQFPIPNLTVKWKISEIIFDSAQTLRSGELPIHFVSDKSDRYEKIVISTNDNQYLISLKSDLTIEGKPGDCNE
ncbi:MAG: hypothetical protein JNM24_07400 [Bdellovibrionaceae bacterium]|nr:hypothetical protein [Pseudobdellovibrionaceae bacterium]